MTATSTLRQSWIIMLRDLKHWQREPWTPLFGIAFTIMLVLVFGYLFGGSIALPGGGDYLDYLMPGMFALAMLFGLEATMSAIANDSKKGVTHRFRSLPISSVAVPLGRAGADLANSAVELLVLMAGGLLIGWQAGGSWSESLLAVGLLLWLRFAVLWLGIFLGLVLRGEGGVMAVQILVWPIGFLSSVFVSPAGHADLAGPARAVEPGLRDGRGVPRAVRQPLGDHRRHPRRPRRGRRAGVAAGAGRGVRPALGARLPTVVGLGR